MNPQAAPTQAGVDIALDDGDIITHATLARIWDPSAAGSSTLLPPSSRPAIGTAPPLGLSRPSHATAEVRDQARAWLASHGDLFDAETANALLHAFETSALTRPPTRSRAALLDAELVDLYLRLCRHWVATTTVTGDPRYLNAAMKVLSVCLVGPVPPTTLAGLALRDALTALDTLAVNLPTTAPAAAPPTAPPRPALGLPGHRPRIAVFAGAASRGLDPFLAAADASAVRVVGVLLHEPGSGRLPPGSSYATAWYPSSTTLRPAIAQRPSPVRGGEPPRVHLARESWTAAAAQLRAWDTDLLVLLGMEVIPHTVLAAPRTATINAHNGALPAYRGMDAIGWAALAGDQPACTVHLATPDVDAGDVLYQEAVSLNSSDLRQAVKDAQIALLVAVCSTFAATGSLPPSHSQTGQARRHYRMHPALKRVLDDRHAPD